MALRRNFHYIFCPTVLMVAIFILIATFVLKTKYSDEYVAQIQDTTGFPIQEFISHSQIVHKKLRDDPIEIFPPPSRLGNLSEFTFVLNRDICGSGPVDLLILIGSHPDHSAMRDVLRDSWGTPRMDRYVVKLAFVFGRPDNASLQQQMVDESAEYGDIVQGQFRDDYSNVTVRDLMGLRWTWRQCPQARFAMHIDDDTCMSIDHILDALEQQMPKEKDYVACFAHWWNAPVLRDGRYGLTKEEHTADTFERYCWGWSYWFTPGAAERLDKVALKHMPYRMNDAYLTGTLVAALGWQHLTLEIKWTGESGQFLKYLNSSESTPPHYILGYSGLNPNFTSLIHKRFRQYCSKNGIPGNIRTTSTTEK